MTSPAQPDPNAAVDAAQTLAAALDGMAKQLKTVNDNSEERDAALKKSARRTRWGLALDIVLTIALALLAWQNSSTSARVTAADARAAAATAHAAAANASDMALHSAQVSGCLVGNQERAGELALWTYLFHASTPGTAAQQKAVALFMQQVNRTFAPRNCQKAYELTPPKGESGGAR